MTLNGRTAAVPGKWLSERKSALEASRAELLVASEDEEREVGRPPEDRGEDITPSQHPADVASDLERHEFALTRQLIHAKELREIEAALARIDAGTYGVCIDCGREISRRRLEVRPQAARDVECERRARQPAR